MPLQPGNAAPYTTALAAVTALDAWRERGFGIPATPEILTRAGVTESLARRTFQSLVTLELLLPDGKPSDQFLDFRATRGDEEYRSRLQEWLRAVYADVLQYADPSTDSHERVTEAFRSYEPAGQRRSMASLLLGLWRYAGLPVAATSAVPASNGQTPRQPSLRRTKPTTRKGTKENRGGGQGAGGNPQAGFDAGGLPPGLVGLLHQIPASGGSWTTARRDGFLQAFTAVLDFSVRIDDNPMAEADDSTEEVDPS